MQLSCISSNRRKTKNVVCEEVCLASEEIWGHVCRWFKHFTSFLFCFKQKFINTIKIKSSNWYIGLSKEVLRRWLFFLRSGNGSTYYFENILWIWNFEIEIDLFFQARWQLLGNIKHTLFTETSSKKKNVSCFHKSIVWTDR